MVSRGESGLSEQSKQSIQKIDKQIRIQVYVQTSLNQVFYCSLSSCLPVNCEKIHE